MKTYEDSHITVHRVSPPPDSIKNHPWNNTEDVLTFSEHLATAMRAQGRLRAICVVFGKDRNRGYAWTIIGDPSSNADFVRRIRENFDAKFKVGVIAGFQSDTVSISDVGFWSRVPVNIAQPMLAKARDGRLRQRGFIFVNGTFQATVQSLAAANLRDVIREVEG
jgi:hypothetical protein